MSIPELEAKGKLCVWAGCGATFPAGAMPDGWIWLLAYHAPHPIVNFGRDMKKVKWRHDAVLCPEHSEALSSLMKFHYGEIEALLDPDEIEGGTQ
jgi:hypothetical protein